MKDTFFVMAIIVITVIVLSVHPPYLLPTLLDQLGSAQLRFQANYLMMYNGV